MNSPLTKHQIFLKPVYSEKSTQMTAINRYSFKVEPSSTKGQIKQSLKELYGVDVIKITTSKKSASRSRSSRTGKYSHTSETKKATVELKKGQKLELFNSLEQ